MIDLERMDRAVDRKDKTVTFCNLVGPFVGRDYNYRFPTVAQAVAFEKLANKRDAGGMPVAIPEKFWRYRVK